MVCHLSKAPSCATIPSPLFLSCLATAVASCFLQALVAFHGASPASATADIMTFRPFPAQIPVSAEARMPALPKCLCGLLVEEWIRVKGRGKVPSLQKSGWPVQGSPHAPGQGRMVFRLSIGSRAAWRDRSDWRLQLWSVLPLTNAPYGSEVSSEPAVTGVSPWSAPPNARSPSPQARHGPAPPRSRLTGE